VIQANIPATPLTSKKLQITCNATSVIDQIDLETRKANVDPVFLAEKAPDLLPRRPVVEKHVEDLLGSARPPKMPKNVAERRAIVPNSRGVERGVKGQKELIDWFFDD
jgi:hypothetical protein